MESLQVLVASMGQKDLSLANKMNFDCSAIIANQTDCCDYISERREYGLVEMYSTDTRGVGTNRNIALAAADAEFILFADDDVCYYDGLKRNILKAFSDEPRADVLVFGVDIIRNGRITERRHYKNKRLHVWNSMRFGTYAIAARREAIEKNSIIFNTNFGGGCIYGSGEDSLFIKACFDCGLRVFSSSYVLGTCSKDASSWFTGCNEKYFFDRGALMGYLFPKMPHLMALYFAVNFKKETDIRCKKRISLMFAGLRAGKKLIPYSEYSTEEST